MFKAYIKNIEQELEKPSRGIGDTFTKVATVIGIKQAVDFFSETMKKDCGCSKRTKAMNEFFSYHNTVDRYISFYVVKNNRELTFKVVDCKQKYDQLDFSNVVVLPLFILRWKDERFAVAEYDSVSPKDIHNNDVISLLKGLMASKTAYSFFNTLANGRYGMTDEDVAVLQTNINLFLKNNTPLH